MKLKSLLVLAALLWWGDFAAFGQSIHAVIYAPTKTVEIESDATTVEIESAATKDVPAIDCNLKHAWQIKAHKEAVIWYAYVDEKELVCLKESKDLKFWFGETARDAWKSAYASGLKEAQEIVEASVNVPVEVYDSETKEQVIKYVSVAEAKALTGKDPDMVKELAEKKDAGLPMKIFDGSK